MRCLGCKLKHISRSYAQATWQFLYEDPHDYEKAATVLHSCEYEAKIVFPLQTQVLPRIPSNVIQPIHSLHVYVKCAQLPCSNSSVWRQQARKLLQEICTSDKTAALNDSQVKAIALSLCQTCTLWQASLVLCLLTNATAWGCQELLLSSIHIQLLATVSGLHSISVVFKTFASRYLQTKGKAGGNMLPKWTF